MKSFTWLVTIVVLIAFVVPVLAGPKDAGKASGATSDVTKVATESKVTKESKSREKSAKKCEADVQTCLNNMYAKLITKGWLGIEMDREKEDELYTIVRVVPDSPAEAAGFLVGDVFAGVNGIYLGESTDEEMKQASKSIKPDADVTYVVLREGARVELTATLAPVPEDVMARWIGSHMLEHVEYTETASLTDD